MLKPTRLSLPALVLVLASPSALLGQTGPNTWGDAKRGPNQLILTNAQIVGAPDPLTGRIMLYGIGGLMNPDILQYDVEASTWTRKAQMPYTLRMSAAWNADTRQVCVLNCRGTTTSLDTYDPSSDTWDGLGELGVATGPGISLACAAGKYYALAGTVNGGLQFYSLDLSLPFANWTLRAPAPAPVGPGAALAWGGGDFLYALRGNGTNAMWRYSILQNQWTALANVPEVVHNGSGLACDAANQRLYCSPGSSAATRSTGFYRFDIAGGTWTTLAARPGAAVTDLGADPSHYGGMTYPGGGDSVYFLRGMLTSDFWVYSISTNRFSSIPQAPAITGAGGGMAGVNSKLYHLQGNGTSGFHRYATETNTWATLAPVPGGGSPYVGDGGCITWGGGDFLYAFRGKGTSDFLRYSISADAWLSSTDPSGALPPMPAQVANGGCMTWDGADTIYAFPGSTNPQSHSTRFLRYVISTNSWSELASTPSGINGGAAIVHPGVGDHLFAWTSFTGDFFWSYQVSTNTWNGGFNPVDPPMRTGTGTAFCHPGGGDKIYAFPGWDGMTASMRFYAYTLPDAAHPEGSWAAKSPVAGMTYTGASLAYPGRGKYLYGMPGDQTSVLWRYWIENDAPAAPDPAQCRADGSTPIPPGGATAQHEIVVTGPVTDPNRDRMLLQLEVKPLGTAFTGNPGEILQSAPVFSGEVATIRVSGLTTGTHYHWRTRTMDIRDEMSPWTDFGNPDPQSDVYIRPNAAPQPLTPRQLEGFATGALAIGGSLKIDARTIVLDAAVSDPDPFPDVSRIHVELRAVGTPFANVPTSSSALVADDEVASLEAPVSEGRWHWQVCAEDEWGARSPWVPFGNNGEDQADFTLMQYGSVSAGGMCSAVGLPSLGLLGLALVALILVLRPLSFVLSA